MPARSPVHVMHWFSVPISRQAVRMLLIEGVKALNSDVTGTLGQMRCRACLATWRIPLSQAGQKKCRHPSCASGSSWVVTQNH